MATLSFLEKYSFPTYDNPRQMQWAELSFDYDKCNQCGLCITACAGGGIITDKYTRGDFMAGKTNGKAGLPRLKLSANGRVLMCVGCLTCAAACPKNAISIKSSFKPSGHFKKLSQAPVMTYPKRY